MKTTPKRVLPSKDKVSRARASKAAPPAPSEPFLRFYHSEGLRQKTLALLVDIERAPDGGAHGAAISGLVAEITSSGLEYYFMRPLRLAKAGFIVEQTASLGLSGVQQLMGTVVRQVIGRMDRPQLLSVCGSLREMMR